MSSANIIRPIRRASRCRWRGRRIEGLRIALLALVVYLCRVAVPAVRRPRRGDVLSGDELICSAANISNWRRCAFIPVAQAKALRRANGGTVFVAGMFIAAFVSIPIVNLATPLFGMAFMVHMHKQLAGGPRRELLEPARATTRLPRASRLALVAIRSSSGNCRRGLLRPLAQFVDQAALALRLARDADVAAVQDQPVMRVQAVLVRDNLLQAPARPRADSCPAPDPVRLPIRNRCVSTAMVGSPNAILSTTFAVLRPTPGSASSASRDARHRAAMLGDQFLRQRDHVLRLVAVKPDRLDVVAHALLAERDHFFRRVGGGKQRGRRLVDAGIGRLRRQHHRDQQRVGIDVSEFAARFGIGALESGGTLPRFRPRSSASAFRL